MVGLQPAGTGDQVAVQTARRAGQFDAGDRQMRGARLALGASLADFFVRRAACGAMRSGRDEGAAHTACRPRLQ